MPTYPTPSIRPPRVEHETVSAQFGRLIEELIAGKMERCRFEPWEVDLLLDFLGCSLNRFSSPFVLRQYQNAVERQLENGAALPMRLSQFLEARAKAPATLSKRRSAAQLRRV
jgi:hypothetical protein